MLEKLREGGSVTFSPKGTSMLPMLRSGLDSVTLTKPPVSLKKGTVALFVLDDERIGRHFILHRLIRVRNGKYFFMGDNRLTFDPPAEYEDILAVVSEFTRKGKKHGVNEFGYRSYSAFMIATSGIRKVTNRLEKFVYRIWKKLFRGKTE